MWNEKKRKSHKNIKAKSKLNFSLEKRVDNSSTIVLKTVVEKSSKESLSNHKYENYMQNLLVYKKISTAEISEHILQII